MNEYRPMLAGAVEEPFTSQDWIFEVKWDGIRAISYIYEELSIRSRNGEELKTNFPELAELKDLTTDVTLDGEIVLLRDGRADFQTLIRRMQATSTTDIEYMSQRNPATYVVFDIIEKGGQPLIDIPLVKRKKILKDALKEGKNIVLSLFVDAKGEAYYNAVLSKGLEGIMAKLKQSRYQPGIRSRDWLKIKRIRTCDCVVLGYTRGRGSRAKTFGALLLGLYEDGKPVYVGKVGTGFDSEMLDELTTAFRGLGTKESIRGVDLVEEVTWLRPAVVVEIAYQSVTEDGKLRIARFRGLRPDKIPKDCVADQIRPKALQPYADKRDFSKTPEPKGGGIEQRGESFVVQEHSARRHHLDLRLEKGGVLKSWAVPKGLPDSPGERRLAVETEDHPLEYAGFEGVIPEGQYGAGQVRVWDKGFYKPIVWNDEKVEFVIQGEKLSGRYVLVKMKKAGEKTWLLLKAED